MSKRTLMVVLAVAVVALGLWLRHYFSPGEVVKRRFLGVVAAFEEERLLGVMASISRSYTDPWGQSYEGLAGRIQEVQETYDALQLNHELSEPRVGEYEVRLTFHFVLWGTFEGNRGYILGSLSDPCTATLLWRKEPQGWRLAATEELDIPELRDELEARRVDR